MEFVRINPLTSEPASTSRALQASDMAAFAARAAAAQIGWGATGPNTRRAVLTKAAAALEAKMADFIVAMMNEIGATEAWARFNVMLAAGMMREAAALTTQISGEIIPSDQARIAMAVREPVGVVLGIAPWNAPIILGVRALAVPLACGNAVILKASESCPRTHELVVEACREGGVPEDVLQIVTNRPEDAADVVGALIDAPEVRRINFTGSTAVGKVIAKRAAEHLKPCLLELGGKAPLIVLADADLDEAVKAAAFGAYMNQGQICMSTERIIVVEEVADAFVDQLAAKVRTLAAGDPREGAAPLGAVVSQNTVDHVRSLVEDAIRQGAELLVGGEADRTVMPAHLVDRVAPDMKLFRDESFGPVCGIVRARDTDHAIELANDSDYGLSAAIFSRDVAGALALARRVRSGICHINGATVSDEPQMPFGGVGASGYGRFGGKAGIDAFTELRWITIATGAGHFPI
ncbi:aldehyde dehydrogenase [Sphingobium sp. DEHP117]|uniref:aldehyde dehydrogenase n=1 Tax=Sphingobium sp. DEHP117 TaxID=2993436 RepID=UPI0027D550F4|nr:aldehyde dehydrogenase family protein [Sphingobium sp. DEHP117]MDQ4419314.1 aldehyde dehydrogenase [Sphingobium sp. DEHP117]